MSHRGVRSGESEEIRESGGTQAEIACWFVFPCFCQGEIITADEREGGTMRDIETRSADDSVKLMVRAIFGKDSGVCDL